MRSPSSAALVPGGPRPADLFVIGLVAGLEELDDHAVGVQGLDRLFE